MQGLVGILLLHSALLLSKCLKGCQNFQHLQDSARLLVGLYGMTPVVLGLSTSFCLANSRCISACINKWERAAEVQLSETFKSGRRPLQHLENINPIGQGKIAARGLDNSG